MRKIFAFLLLGFFVAIAQAQPVLSAGHYNIQPGDVYFANFLDSTGFQPGVGGANLSWDSSVQNLDSAKYAQATHPGAYQAGQFFPDATVAFPNAQPGIALVAFFQINSDSVTNLGHTGVANSPAGATTIFSIYENPQLLCVFPMSFNDSIVDTFSAVVESRNLLSPLPAISYRFGTTTTTFDAYGTLVTHFGTFQDVIRLKYEEAYRDSGSFFGMTMITDFKTENYLWINSNTGDPLLQYNVIREPNLGFGLFEYQQLPVANDPSLDGTSLQLFPNQTQTTTQVHFTLLQTTACQLSLLDLQGRQLKTQNLGTLPAGENKVTLDVSDVASGMYLVELKVGESKQFRRLQVN